MPPALEVQSLNQAGPPGKSPHTYIFSFIMCHPSRGREQTKGSSALSISNAGLHCPSWACLTCSLGGRNPRNGNGRQDPGACSGLNLSQFISQPSNQIALSLTLTQPCRRSKDGKAKRSSQSKSSSDFLKLCSQKKEGKLYYAYMCEEFECRLSILN